jgi:hypothetical protein
MTHDRPVPRRRLLLLTGAALVTVAAFAMSGCTQPAKNGGRTADRAGTGGLNANADTTPSAALGGAPTSTGRPTGQPTATPSRGTTATTASGPQIVSFTVVGNANCGANGPGYSSPGTVTLSWKVTGANSVALSIDNPNLVGAYRSGYGLEATETLPFGCGGEIGSKVTHRYTIVAVYPGADKVRTLDVSATYYG